MFTPHHGVHRDLGKIGLTTENVANFVKFFFQQSQLFGLFYGGGLMYHVPQNYNTQRGGENNF
jgi:hypothetical protein